MDRQIKQAIQTHATPFQSNADLKPIIGAIGDANIVLLGEASHGTSEFYSIRAELTKRLIVDKGFEVIAVEGDWPACQKVNHYIKHYNAAPDIKEVLKAFNRWPSWMWANEEMAELFEWIKHYNLAQEKKIGFYGIDVYSLYESMDEIMNYLKETEAKGADLELAKKAFHCLDASNRQEEQYAISAAFFSESCIDEVTKLLASIRSHEGLYNSEQEEDLNLKMNALAAKNAENYYRTMVQHDAESWNIRDRHMVEALEEIRTYYGDETKVIVWEHNTHVGDASATDMNDAGMINVGQLLREQNKKEDVFIVGFGTNKGSVIAAEEWGQNLERKIVPQAVEGSWEHAMHQAGAHNKFLIFTNDNKHLFQQKIGHRAIGVVYNPEFESYGNYVPSVVGNRYDAFIYVDQSHALHPIDVSPLLQR
ncbi:erythromycin esterase family protein [Radiobacillus deserti]|uniref:Erythromycin esterase family protein n=1 Tax=Radiobacillus deserti TaxID=2594883 RepID=A0A516KEL5_9BACI|nr:erythromycin esterase family protein [Radiobacillus deserti]QDP39854.1 erythromycin esterase family protein [Radiobacillus deserti]